MEVAAHGAERSWFVPGVYAPRFGAAAQLFLVFLEAFFELKLKGGEIVRGEGPRTPRFGSGFDSAIERRNGRGPTNGNNGIKLPSTSMLYML
jgi:hypothetical protein